MKIGEVIRKYRKEKQLTQEEMAKFLGVTAPAVNKWENGNSFPDITLLAPIARLLGITTDTLLSYRDELTDQEINQILAAIGTKIENENYDAAFQWVEQQILEYPDCDRLILLAALSLNGYRYFYGITGQEKCERKICEWYNRVLSSRDNDISQNAAMALYQMYMIREDYEKAQEYLDRIPGRGFNKKQMQTNLYRSQGKTEEAYRLYEEILFNASYDLTGAANGLFSLAVGEKDMEKARMIVDKQKELARTLEMGTLMEKSCELELAAHMQDKETIFSILEELAGSAEELYSFRKSPLYTHMQFSGAGSDNIMRMLQNALENDESLDFIRSDPRYTELVEKIKF